MEDTPRSDLDGGYGLLAAQSLLPQPERVTVTAGRYLTSAVRHQDCPPPKFPEFAVIGRSNVGKSSVINMLTGIKQLALVSKEPGKTKCINHFLINNSWYLVDLPGYGYARTGRNQRDTFDAFTKAYFTQRPNLVMVLLLVDSSIPPQSIDLEYAGWLTQHKVPFTVVFTKADKRRHGAKRPHFNATDFLSQLSSRLDSSVGNSEAKTGSSSSQVQDSDDSIVSHLSDDGSSSSSSGSSNSGSIQDSQQPGVSSDESSQVSSVPTAAARFVCPPYVITSAVDDRGKRPLLRFIASLRIAFERSGQLDVIMRESAAATLAVAAAARQASARLRDLGEQLDGRGGGAAKRTMPPGGKKRKPKKLDVNAGLRQLGRVRPPRAVLPNADDDNDDDWDEQGSARALEGAR